MDPIDAQWAEQFSEYISATGCPITMVFTIVALWRLIKKGGWLDQLQGKGSDREQS